MITNGIVCLDMTGKQLVVMIFLLGLFLGAASNMLYSIVSTDDDPFNKYDAETWRN